MGSADDVLDRLLRPGGGSRSERTRQAEIMAERRRRERDITIPEVVDPERKESCRLNLVLFCTTYLRRWFYLEVGPFHVEQLANLENVALRGGQQSIAAPRGFGKDTLAIAALMWAACYGHVSYSVFICYEMGQALARLSSIRSEFEENELLLEDFPEICGPVRALDRAPQRAKLQTYRGKHTRMEWGGERIILPTVEGAACSGCIIEVSSLSGSVRGLNVNGERPRLVVVTDPQTRAVAKSPTMRKDVVSKIKADVGGLGGPDTRIAVLVLCTVIDHGDAADQLTNRETCPEWFGYRYKALVSWPDRLDMWEKYWDLCAEDARHRNDRDLRGAHAYYLKNRKKMDAGAEVLWKENFTRVLAADGSPLEVSAVQHLMNDYWRMGEDAFLSEYQNQPPEPETAERLTTDDVVVRLSHVDQKVVPVDTEALVRFVDVGAREVHYVTMAVGPKAQWFQFVDYDLIQTQVGAEEAVKRKRDSGRLAAEERIVQVLQQIRDEELRGLYRDATGKERHVRLTGLDVNWADEPLLKFCRESGARWRPCVGLGGPGTAKFNLPSESGRRGARAGPQVGGRHWYLGTRKGRFRVYNLDSVFYKMHLWERMSQDVGTAGALTLFGSSERRHRLFAGHMVAESWDPELGKLVVHSKFNHWLDAGAGCFAMADMMGLTFMPETKAPKREGERANREGRKRRSGGRGRWKPGSGGHIPGF